MDSQAQKIHGQEDNDDYYQDPLAEQNRRPWDGLVVNQEVQAWNQQRYKMDQLPTDLSA